MFIHRLKIKPQTSGFTLQRWYAAGNIQLVKDLRSQTGAPVGDVKSALEEAKWDLSEAFKLLRKKGLAAAKKKETRLALQGLVGVSKSDSCVSLVELNCETDFVAKNESFYTLLPRVAKAALESDVVSLDNGVGIVDVEQIKQQQQQSTVDGGETSTIADTISDVATNVRENIVLRRAYKIMAQNGITCSYIHNAVKPNFLAGQIVTALSFEMGETNLSLSEEELRHKKTSLEELGNRLCMQIAAFNPVALSIDSVPDELVQQEKAIFMENARAEGKPEVMLEKIVNGRMKKFFEENVLMEQNFVMDDALKVKDVILQKGKALGFPNIKVSNFLYIKCGENVDQVESSQ